MLDCFSFADDGSLRKRVDKFATITRLASLCQGIEQFALKQVLKITLIYAGELSQQKCCRHIFYIVDNVH